MFDRLAVYALPKHFTINTTKSEAVYFDSKLGAEVPISKVAGDAFKR